VLGETYFGVRLEAAGPVLDGIAMLNDSVPFPPGAGADVGTVPPTSVLGAGELPPPPPPQALRTKAKAYTTPGLASTEARPAVMGRTS